jgi:hypothetical protein
MMMMMMMMLMLMRMRMQMKKVHTILGSVDLRSLESPFAVLVLLLAVRPRHTFGQ